jgi:hypothetical protein
MAFRFRIADCPQVCFGAPEMLIASEHDLASLKGELRAQGLLSEEEGDLGIAAPALKSPGGVVVPPEAIEAVLEHASWGLHELRFIRDEVEHEYWTKGFLRFCERARGRGFVLEPLPG